MNKGTFTLDGKIYNCEVKNGIYTIEGKTVDEFINSLTVNQVVQFVKIGFHKMLNPEKSALKMHQELEGTKYN